MTKPKVSLIVPVWCKDEDAWNMTKRAIDSMLTTTYENYNLVLVDDCSPYTPTFQLLIDRYSGYGPKMRWICQTPENGGSTVAVNYGISMVWNEADHSDFFQYQNNDIEITHPGWLDEQMKLFTDPQVGVVGCLMRYPHGTIQHAGACWRAIGNHSIDHIGQHQETIKYLEDVPFVTGCGMTVRREILERNGGGFTVFKGYGWDDIDIQVKAKDWGWKIKVAPFASFTHYGSVSYKERPDLASVENMQANKALFDNVPITEEETIGYFKKHYYEN